MLVRRYFQGYQPATLWCISAAAWEEINFWWKWEFGPRISSLVHVLCVRISADILCTSCSVINMINAQNNFLDFLNVIMAMEFSASRHG